LKRELSLASNEPISSDSYEELIQKFISWANAQPDVRMAVVLGSRARTDHPADEWADLDILMVTINPKHYVDTSEWTAEMGKPIATFIEETSGADEQERRVLYGGMLDVDYAVFPASKVERLLKAEVNTQMPAETVLELANAFGRGMRIILDKDGLSDKLKGIISGIKQPRPQLPTQQEFLQVVNDFLYHCVWTVKHIMRGELWWALTCLNCRLASLQLRMTEWQARATHGKDYDTWFRGRFLEKWANPEVTTGLKNAYGHYDKNDVSTALMGSLNLFRQTATTTAEKLNLQYPTEADKKITVWIASQLKPDSKT
jgi:aminoglycoside 6-adenylyltransferase